MYCVFYHFICINTIVYTVLYTIMIIYYVIITNSLVHIPKIIIVNSC